MNTSLTVQEILQILKKDGELWYFYLLGKITIHSSKCESSTGKHRPIKDMFCPIEVFHSLEKDGLIEKIGHNDTGYPFYANDWKSDIYTITELGKKSTE